MKPHINKLLDAVSRYNREIRSAFDHSETKEDLSNNWGAATGNLKHNLKNLGLADHFDWDVEDNDVWLRESHEQLKSHEQLNRIYPSGEK